MLCDERNAFLALNVECKLFGTESGYHWVQCAAAAALPALSWPHGTGQERVGVSIDSIDHFSKQPLTSLSFSRVGGIWEGLKLRIEKPIPSL